MPPPLVFYRIPGPKITHMGDDERGARIRLIGRWLAILIGAGLLFGLGRVSGAPDTWWSDWLRSPGFAGVAAVSAAVIAYVAATLTSRSQREQAEQDRAERVRSERKSQWWSRAQWALDLMKEQESATREMGLRFLGALAKSEWADQHEGDIVAAASGEALAAERESIPTAALRMLTEGETPEVRRTGAEILAAQLENSSVVEQLGVEGTQNAASAIAKWYELEGCQSDGSGHGASE